MLLDQNIEPMEILNGLGPMQRNDDVFGSPSHEFEATNDKINVSDINDTDKDVQKTLADSHLKSGHYDYVEPIITDKAEVESAIMDAFKCSGEEAARIYFKHSDKFVGIKPLKANIELLKQHGGDSDAIQTCSNVAFLPLDALQRRIELVEQMKPTNIRDFLPLLAVDDEKLGKFSKNIGDDQDSMIHPIYYFSEYLNVSLKVMSRPQIGL